MNKICFVVCPIGEEGSEIRKRSDQVFRHIIDPVCKEKGYVATRVDQIHNTDKIDQTIIEHLKTADIVIADLSDKNPNAFFELGYRSATNKPLVHIVEEGQNLPFDVSNIRTIAYKLTDPDKLLTCKQRLAETIDVLIVDIDVDISNDIEPRTPLPQPANEVSMRNVNSQILTHLLDIKDSLSSLHQGILNKDDKVVEQIISAFTNKIQSNSTAQERFTEFALKEFLKDPEKMMDTFNKFPGIKFPNQT